MNHLDLFSGIGGFALALDLCQLPVQNRYFSEICPYAIQVYQKNYPQAKALGDIRNINGHELRAKHEGNWILTGGFPCQDISDAGHRKGLQGERSGLWFEMLRLIRELKPELVLIENVAALRNRGLGEVLQGLNESGYDAEWRTLSALEIGAIHKRERLWITGYPRYSSRDDRREYFSESQSSRDLGDCNELSSPTTSLLSRTDWQRIKAEGQICGQPCVARRHDGLSSRLDFEIDSETHKDWLRRTKMLGNAIVPQCAARVLQDWFRAEQGNLGQIFRQVDYRNQL
jgi:DNA-cytosine methyltransferase